MTDPTRRTAAPSEPPRTPDAAHRYPASIEAILTAQQQGAASLLNDAACPYGSATEADDFLREMWVRGRVAGMSVAGLDPAAD